MIYLYALTEPGRELAQETGIDGAPVEEVMLEGLSAICSRHAELELRTDAAALWHHERVVEQVMERGPTLPVRFGTTFLDEEAMRSALASQVLSSRRALQRVRDCVELAVRVTAPDRRPVPGPGGRAYLEARLASEGAAAEAFEQVLGPLRSRAVAVRRLERPAGAPLLSVSYLVRRAQVAAFVSEVARVQGLHPELSISATGPWAPYSFVEEEAAA